jgi:mRNA interferase MazF
MAIELTNDSLSEGSLNSVSYFRPAKLFTAHESLMSRTVARLKPEVFNQLLDAVVGLLNQNRI